MKKTSDFYKVVNAVINTLNHGECVVYVSGGQGGSGEGMFDCDEDNDKVRDSLLQFADCNELDEDELLGDWSEEVLEGARKSGFDFWELYNYGDNAPCLQVLINPDYYVKSSYELRDMIAEDLDLERAEITEGMNGYPSHLRGCVLINDGKRTIDELMAISERYGVELVSLNRRDGWQLWQCEGWTCDLYDMAEYISNHDDNFKWADSWKGFADDIREFVEDNARYNEIDEGKAKALRELADIVEQREPLKDGECISWEYNDFERYEVIDRMTDHFSYDTKNFSLAFDCMIEE